MSIKKQLINNLAYELYHKLKFEETILGKGFKFWHKLAIIWKQMRIIDKKFEKIKLNITINGVHVEKEIGNEERIVGGIGKYHPSDIRI